jgi:hypothetical protein
VEYKERKNSKSRDLNPFEPLFSKYFTPKKMAGGSSHL